MASLGVQNLVGVTAVSLDRRLMGVRWGAVRAFCDRIGAQVKWDGGGDQRPIRGGGLGGRLHGEVKVA
jgi:hypothetical protein